MILLRERNTGGIINTFLQDFNQIKKYDDTPDGQLQPHPLKKMVAFCLADGLKDPCQDFVNVLTNLQFNTEHLKNDT